MPMTPEQTREARRSVRAECLARAWALTVEALEQQPGTPRAQVRIAEAAHYTVIAESLEPS